MPSNNKHRGWILTINNPTEDEQRIAQVLGGEKNLQYACGELERGENGTLHIQAYVEWKGPRTFQTVHKLFPRAHIEPRGGTASDARDYCLKRGKWANDTTAQRGTEWEVGAFKEAGNGRGARNDLSEVCAFLDAGGGLNDAFKAFPGVCARYMRFVERYALMLAKRREWKTKVIVYKGPTGCGKTSRAHEEYPTIWTKPHGYWFDTYSGEEHVLFDDFDGGRESGIAYRQFLQLTDRYPMLVPVKGGFVQWVPRVLVITTNVEPRDWYPSDPFDAIERRLDEVHRISDP